MSCGDEVRRMIMKRSFTAGEKPTVPPNEDHRSGLWSPTDIYIGEQFFNAVDGTLYTRSNDGIEVVETSENSSKTLYAEVAISSAELLAINTTPKAILPAAPTNSYYKYEAILEYNYNTTAYTVSSGGELYLDQGDPDYYFPNLMINKSFDTLAKGTHYGYAEKETALTLTSNSNPTLGDGTLLLKIWYSIETFGSNL